MQETLEDLYYGNITPYDRQICSSTSLRNAMDQSHKYEEQLTKLLEGEATVCCCGSSTQGTRSAVLWLWRISSWASVRGRD